MHKLNQRGELLVPLIVVIVLFVASIGFGLWAFMGRQDYKNNVDEKIAQAVKVAEENVTIRKDAEFAEQYKLPNATYQGPAAFGTLSITYPKTWSVYVDESGNGSAPLSGYMHPKFVPANEETNFALRFEVLERNYEQELKSFDSAVKNDRAQVSAYRLPKVKSVLGVRVVGEISNRKQGVLVLLPLRDKVVKIWTEGQDHRGDFETILKNLSFIP